MTDAALAVSLGGSTAMAGSGEPDAVEGATNPASEARAGRLLELAVMDLALIERLRLAFEPGLNVLTGETGAGKSLVIDALGLALGARADLSLVRHGAELARVEATFDRQPDPLRAVRELAASGRSAARVGDEPVTAARLAETVGPLVEVHGQHDQSRLLDEAWQRDVLDAFGGHAELRAAVADAVATWAENRALLDGLAVDPREVARRIDVLGHEVEEIAGARLRPGEAEELRSRLDAARHGEAIARGAAAIRTSLASAGDGLDEPMGRSAGGTSAREGLAVALREARSLGRLDPRFEALAERLAGLEAELEDAAAEARTLADQTELDSGAVAGIEERLSTIYALERRYGEDEAAVLAHAERAAAELDRLAGIDAERARREADDGRLLLQVADVAAELSRRRALAAAELAGAVDGTLQPLGFRAGAFDVGVGRRIAGPHEAAVELDGDAVAFDASGADEVVFRFAPNAGEPARPLAKIASGGELSRVALAIKQVLAAADATPTLVFDEVDSGIGGRTADPVGRSLWRLGRSHQVLVVTHLAQIAAHADAHFRIAKRERDGRTITEVERLDAEGRVTELAAMLGADDLPAATAATADGPALAPSLVASARALLEAAEALHARERGR
ncbi:MAG TPA: DNA repair protein RecN [Candidatus Limnocylindrales bacterium]